MSEEREEPILTEGWGIIRPGDRKAHYYRTAMSLCGRVGFYFGSLFADEFPTKDDCRACRAKLETEKAKAAQAAADKTGNTP